MTYLEYHFSIAPLQPACDILIAELGELGFESFVELEDGLLAYIPKEEAAVLDIHSLFVLQNTGFQITWSSKEIQQQNWNVEWERNFQPIKVGSDCLVRAPFHPKEAVRHDIVIAPKMSFGTGHHETTHMMLELLLAEQIKDSKVLDMGSGTGVLAILASQKGAGFVDAIDVDPWCFENALENVSRNGCENIKVMQGDAATLELEKYDLILANINRNILIKDIPTYVASLKRLGSLFLSGFYFNDLDMISSKCGGFGLRLEKKLMKNDWVAAKYVF